MSWPNFQRQPRPHPDAYIEGIYTQIDALKAKDIMTPFKPEDQTPGEDASKERPARKLRTKPTILFGGKPISPPKRREEGVEGK